MVHDTRADTTRAQPRQAATTQSQSVADTAHTTQSPAAHRLGRPVDGPPGSWHERARSKPGFKQAYRFGVFATGLLFIALGLALAVLPGPLTIPPVLIGLWIWSTEFRFARKLFDSFKRKAQDAWQHAKARPVSSTAITVGGLTAASAAAWGISHFDLIAKGQEAIGL